ncbi:MAG: hypothetical protein BWX80_04090 [Candidatus Hydrogenedentes bacterium ADurb.Bin101]|nr:MAG: hypothetical protein BWX80_04090 [Candidatus Hydrogenedentes bacterium ADurb.Bin101]
MLACCGHSGAATLYRQCQRNQIHLAFTFTLNGCFAFALRRHFAFGQDFALTLGQNFTFAFGRDFAFALYRHPLHRGQAEPEAITPIIRQVGGARSGTAVNGITVPGIAPADPVYISRRSYPGAPVRGRAGIVAVPVILTPFVHVAAHVKQPEGIGQFPAHRLGADDAIVTAIPEVVRSVALQYARGAVRTVSGTVQGVAEIETRLRARAAGIFPLCFAGQSHREGSLARIRDIGVQSGDKFPDVLPGNIVRGIRGTEAIIIGGHVRRIRPGIAHCQPLSLRHLILAHPEALGQRHLVLRGFPVITSFLSRIAPHEKGTFGDPDQFQGHTAWKQDGFLFTFTFDNRLTLSFNRNVYYFRHEGIRIATVSCLPTTTYPTR